MVRNVKLGMWNCWSCFGDEEVLRPLVVRRLRDHPVDMNLSQLNILSHLVDPNPKIRFGTTADTFY